MLREITSVVHPAKILESHFEVLLKAYGVHNMPAVHSEAFLRTVSAIRTNHLAQSCIRGAEFGEAAVTVEVVGAAEIVLCAGSANGRIVFVAVDEELDLSFSPPAVVVHTKRYIGTDILTFTLDTVHEGKVGRLVVGSAAELRVEVGRIFRDLGEGLVDLVVERHLVAIVDVFHRDLALLAERHAPVAVESAAGIDTDGKGHKG